MVREAPGLTDEGVILELPPRHRAAGQFEMVIEIGTPVDESVLATLDSAMAPFVAAANRGAFPGGGAPPSASRLMIGSQGTLPGRRVQYWVEGEAIDLFGFELLRNVVDGLGQKGPDVRRITVTTTDGKDGSREKPEPNDRTEYEAYPPLSQLLGFAYLREPHLDDSRLRRCLVELTTRVQAAHVSRLNDWVMPWFQLLEAGAFALPVGHAWEVGSVGGSAAIFDEQTIELCVNRFEASECAWHGLLHMLNTCWGDARQISTVTIE